MSPLLINSSANMTNGIKPNAIPHSTAVAAAKSRVRSFNCLNRRSDVNFDYNSVDSFTATTTAKTRTIHQS